MLMMIPIPSTLQAIRTAEGLRHSRRSRNSGKEDADVQDRQLQWAALHQALTAGDIQVKSPHLNVRCMVALSLRACDYIADLAVPPHISLSNYAACAHRAALRWTASTRSAHA